MKQSLQAVLDRLAIAGSILCALHCLLVPILLTIFPSSISLFLQDESFHHLMVWFVVPSSLIAVFLGCRKHKDFKILAGVSLGLTIIVLTVLFGHDFLGEQGEKIATIVGAVFLAISHIRNYKLCRKSDCSTEM